VDQRFARHLADLLRRRGLSQRTFARLAGASPGYLSQVLRGQAAAPDGIDAWAAALDLAGDERERFLDHAALTRTPERIIDRLSRAEDMALRGVLGRDGDGRRVAEPQNKPG
jgi:transcriptional regulator with XRE-family HTH domain